jgi:hypothetical protein
MREALPLAAAAKHLNVTPAAVHKRLRRGTLDGYKTADNRWMVWVDTGVNEDMDTSTTGQRLDAGMTNDDSSMTDLYERLLSQQHERIAFLEQQVTTLNQIIHAQTQQPLALPAPTESEPSSEPVPRLPWWKRWFG